MNGPSDVCLGYNSAITAYENTERRSARCGVIHRYGIMI